MYICFTCSNRLLGFIDDEINNMTEGKASERSAASQPAHELFQSKNSQLVHCTIVSVCLARRRLKQIKYCFNACAGSVTVCGIEMTMALCSMVMHCVSVQHQYD